MASHADYSAMGSGCGSAWCGSTLLSVQNWQCWNSPSWGSAVPFLPGEYLWRASAQQGIFTCAPIVPGRYFCGIPLQICFIRYDHCSYGTIVDGGYICSYPYTSQAFTYSWCPWAWYGTHRRLNRNINLVYY
ncbi:hypothetical protein D3C78_951290 [compost metagenome]